MTSLSPKTIYWSWLMLFSLQGCTPCCESSDPPSQHLQNPSSCIPKDQEIHFGCALERTLSQMIPPHFSPSPSKQRVYHIDSARAIKAVEDYKNDMVKKITPEKNSVRN